MGVCPSSSFTEFGRDLEKAGKPLPREGRAALGSIQKVKVRNASLFHLQGFKKTFCAVKRVPEYFFRHSTGNSAGAWGRKGGPAWLVAFSLKALSSIKNSAGAGDLYSESDPAVLFARYISMQNTAPAPRSCVPFLAVNSFMSVCVSGGGLLELDGG